MLKSFLAATTVAASLSILTASAQAADPAPIDTRIVTSVTLDDLRSIVTGYEHTVLEDLGDQNGLLVETPGGFKYLALLRMCDEAQACQGVVIGSVHDLPEGTSWELLNQLDAQMEAFGLPVAETQLIIARMFILSGGVQVENFKHEIGRLVLVAPAVVNGMNEALSAPAEG